jgi:hypothetical protein
VSTLVTGPGLYLPHLGTEVGNEFNAVVPRRPLDDLDHRDPA